jgi:hypothetical protein
MIERFNLEYSQHTATDVMVMVTHPTGEWVRFDDLISDARNRDPRDPAVITVLGVSIGTVARLLNEVHEITGKTVTEWYKHVDERIVSAATAFVEYVPGMRWKKPADPRREKILAVLNRGASSEVQRSRNNVDADAILMLLDKEK